jgi:hypothetical protein
MIGQVGNDVSYVPFERTWLDRKPIPTYLSELSTLLV